MKELKIKQIPNHISAVRENGKFLRTQPDNGAGPLFLQEVTKDHVGSTCTVFKIDDFKYADGKLTLNARISFPEVCKSIALQANLINEETEQVIYSLDEKTVENNTDLTYEYDGVPIIANAECEHSAVIVYADWVDKAGAEGEAALFEDDNQLTIKYDHKYPKKENGYKTFGDVVWPKAEKIAEERREIEGREESENIIIALVRAPDDAKDLDYLCQFGHKEWIGNVDYPAVCVPAHGKLDMITSGAKFLNKDKPITAICSISPPGVGGALVTAVGLCDSHSYQTKDGEISITVPEDGSSITYDMTKPWDAVFLDSGSFDLHEFDYDLTITFYVSINGKPESDPHTFSISSKADTKKSRIEHIPRITIKWGCLAEGTEILMAKGKKKPIQEIKIGDRVKTDEGIAEITNVWRGKEEECLLVRTDNRRKLILTKGHPVCTKKGWKRAGELTCLDVLKTRTGWSAIRKIERLTKTIKVYNPETGGKIIYANGFVTGDFTLQNTHLGEE